MMQYVIAGIILVIIIFLFGFFYRKRYYTEIDRLEAWKIEIMNKPVSDELSKVKQLNMTGQTEELFERWRQAWDEIVAGDLPQVEELLFDAEENTDKFRLNKAKEVQMKIENVLTGTEEKIENILTELNVLVGSEEKNRLEIESLKENYRESKKKLLAYRHTYGKTAKEIETKLDELSSNVEQIDELTGQGNYLDAREMVISLSDEMNTIMYRMEVIPPLLSECQTVIPAQINELVAGFKEMEDQGYMLEHIDIDNEIDALKRYLEEISEKLQSVEIEIVEEGTKEIKERIEVMYDLLEKEVHSKHFVVQYKSGAESALLQLKENNENLQYEMNYVQQGYHLEEKEMYLPKELEKKIDKLLKRYAMFETKFSDNQTAFSFLNDELKEMRDTLNELDEQQKEFELHLQTLRKDELSAREKLVDLKKQISEAGRIVSKSNIPGLPVGYMDILEEAQRKIEQVNVSLNEKPLNMGFVQESLQQAIDTVQHFHDKTNELVENAMLSEKVIQYGNRYRSSYASVAENLQIAENAFRSFEYRTALEHAATAVESVEPGAMEKVEKLVNEEISNR
jgi:septation ring formation regulator